MVCLDESGEVVRPALLWNDTRSAAAAADLVVGARRPRARGPTAVGSVPVASFTVTKLRWLAEHEPAQRRAHGRGLPAARLADVAAGRPAGLDELTTDRSDASGTGYWSPRDRRVPPRPAGARASAATPSLPAVLEPARGRRATCRAGALLGAGRR